MKHPSTGYIDYEKLPSDAKLSIWGWIDMEGKEPEMFGVRAKIKDNYSHVTREGTPLLWKERWIAEKFINEVLS